MSNDWGILHTVCMCGWRVMSNDCCGILHTVCMCGWRVVSNDCGILHTG